MIQKRIAIIATIVIIVLAISYICKIHNNKIIYDNTTHYSEIITQTYSEKKIHELEQQIDSDHISFDRFKKDFNVQCIRKTLQCYYAVLLQDDGTRVFVFIEQDSLELLEIYKVNEFKNRQDFEDWISNNDIITLSDILDFDKSTYSIRYSSVDATAHFVKEGVFVLQYERIIGVTGEDSKVTSIAFFNNNDERIMGKWGVPYLLEIDKN